MIDPKPPAERRARDLDDRLIDLLLDLAVPAMAALLTLGVFLFAVR